MSNTEQQEKEELRKSLGLALQKCPARLNSASIQQVRVWKETYAKAKKVFEKSRSTPAELVAAINSIQ